MLAFISRIFGFGKAGAERRDAEAKAWLDDLRRNELSMTARRRIAPDEPVRVPHIGHGAALATQAPPDFSTMRTRTPKGESDFVSAGVVDSSIDTPASSAASGDCSGDGGGSDSCSD